MRADIDRYRLLTWSFERVARARRTPTSYSYRRSTDPAYLRWALSRWERRQYLARRRALRTLREQIDRSLLGGPGPHAAVRARIAFSKRLTLRLRRIYPGEVPRRYAAAHGRTPRATLDLWQRRAAAAVLQVARHSRAVSARDARARRLLQSSSPLTAAFLCIHRYEGSWRANTGNGYYGGLQMDSTFMRTYAADYLRRWGTADGWPAWAQVDAAERAYRSGRGFRPWPNSARACGLL